MKKQDKGQVIWMRRSSLGHRRAMILFVQAGGVNGYASNACFWYPKSRQVFD
jgi:hypothetical protein